MLLVLSIETLCELLLKYFFRLAMMGFSMEMQQLRYVVAVARREATETKDLLRGTVSIGVLAKALVCNDESLSSGPSSVRLAARRLDF
ncbi:MAG TPA: hypothetical protein VMJ12_18855 [Candidatus Acidoferrales bacterium]|nr:hypothetical protein [Candidatus Acidoferrales bacterium]